MSDDLRVLGSDSEALFADDEEAVDRHWSPDFVSHVTAGVAPDAERRGPDGEPVESTAPPCSGCATG